MRRQEESKYGRMPRWSTTSSRRRMYMGDNVEIKREISGGFQVVVQVEACSR
jgi:hypothetical protein